MALISLKSKNEKIRTLATNVVVLDENNQPISRVESFDVATKEAFCFVMSGGTVKVVNNEAVVVKELKPNWRCIFQPTKEEVTVEFLKRNKIIE